MTEYNNTNAGETEQLRLISPKEFRERYAPSVGLPTVRELFHRADFPSVQMGSRLYTTPAAAVKWLEAMGSQPKNNTPS
jgi:hypothetical protein